MAIRLADAVAFLRTDDSELKRGLDEGETKVSRWGGVVHGALMGVGFAAFNAVAGAARSAVGYLGESVTAASDIAETSSKISVLFGDESDSLLAWAENAATALGQSKQQALDAAATFGIFGQAAGLGGDELVEFSTGLTGLATDLASFNNTTPEQAITAIGAALRGESEPLRQYGVLLDDASMRAKAMELGIYDGNGALTSQQKILAAQALIYEQTSAAQGDFERTSGGLANQQRILDAQMQNLKTTIGTALLPVALTLTTWFNEMVTRHGPSVQAFVTDKLIPAFTWIADIIRTVVLPAIQNMIGFFTGLGEKVRGTADGPLTHARQWFDENLPLIRQTVETILTWIQNFWAAHGETIMTVVMNTFNTVKIIIDTVLGTVLDLIKLAMQIITGDWEGAGETLIGIVERLWNSIKAIVRSQLDSLRAILSDFGGDMLAAGGRLINQLSQGISNAWTGLIENVRARLRQLRDLLPFSEPKDASSPLRNLAASGRALVDNIQTGIDGLRLNIDGPASGLAASGAGGGPISITINVNGGGDGVGESVRGGVLSALRQAGLR
jgi:hypothetical protein